MNDKNICHNDFALIIALMAMENSKNTAIKKQFGEKWAKYFLTGTLNIMGYSYSQYLQITIHSLLEILNKGVSQIQNWKRHFTEKRNSSKMAFPNNDNRWKGIVEKSWQDTSTILCL